MTEIQALRISVTGRVQGVGFRPFVTRTARALEVSGWVRNRSGEVEIHAEATKDKLDHFLRALKSETPPLARPNAPTITKASITGTSGFHIRNSDSGAQPDIHIPPDYFVCNDCLAEMNDPAARRFRYPFINCTQCGPRYTLIAHLPYDRPNTALADFMLCEACRLEYLNPADRRYHAQPLACADCGPRLTFSGETPLKSVAPIWNRSAEPRPSTCSERTVLEGQINRLAGESAKTQNVTQTGNDATLAACILALREGLIVAVKGVGGYHLMCDAQNESTVMRLRERKGRPAKPLAVLTPWRGWDGLAWAEQLAILKPIERKSLTSPERPIVLVQKQPKTPLAPSIAPHLNEVGLMLPYSPLHHLLANEFDAPLVATSANLSGEPVLTDACEVENRLAHVADAFLHHDRPILRPADDSIYRRIAGHMQPLRMGRGTAPIERTLPFKVHQPLLALGSDLKNTVALAFEDRVIISPHIGDLSAVRSEKIFEQTISDITHLYGVQPTRLVCDAHPDYHSSHWAQQRGLALTRISHHHAHASALAGDYQHFDPMVVFTWDGTGYGEDGTIWGGETLWGQPGHWQRTGSLRPFSLPGGERVNREPWRTACALCWEAGIDWLNSPADKLLHQMWQRGLNSPTSSSAGRLFDAAAALMGLITETSYEGQAAMMLESIFPAKSGPIPLPLSLSETGVWLSDWTPLLPMLMNPDLTLPQKSACFHASLAGTIDIQARKMREIHGINTVGLSGGVFQNRRLVEQARAKLEQSGFQVLLHRTIPANDAGISFGQIVEAGCRAV